MSVVAVLRGLAPFSVAIVALGLVVGGAFPVPGPSPQSSPSLDPGARCELTPDAPPDATIQIHDRAFGPSMTVKAGQAVVFQSLDGTAHTVTEGIAGHAADNACARQRLPPHGRTVVTFHLAGDYRFTCTIHPSMHTEVRVR